MTHLGHYLFREMEMTWRLEQAETLGKRLGAN